MRRRCPLDTTVNALPEAPPELATVTAVPDVPPSAEFLTNVPAVGVATLDGPMPGLSRHCCWLSR